MTKIKKTKKKNKFRFNFDSNPSLFDQPEEEVSLPLQILRTLKAIAVLQLGYALVGYAVTITGGLLANSYDIWSTFIQAPGGISLLTIIAAIIVRFECNSKNNRGQLIAYMVLVGLDMVAWVAKLFFTFDALVIQAPHGIHDIMIAFCPFFVVIALQVFGVVEAAKLRMSVTEHAYTPLNMHHDSRPSDEASARTFRSLCFYSLLRICFLQLLYVVVMGYVVVFVSFADKSVDTPTAVFNVLVSPATAIFTFGAALCVLVGITNSRELPKRYMICVGIDAVICVGRLIVGFSIGEKLLQDSTDIKTQFLGTGLWAVFTFVLWVVGFLEAYKTKTNMFEHNNVTTQVDHIFSL